MLRDDLDLLPIGKRRRVMIAEVVPPPRIGLVCRYGLVDDPGVEQWVIPTHPHDVLHAELMRAPVEPVEHVVRGPSKNLKPATSGDGLDLVVLGQCGGCHYPPCHASGEF